MHAFGVHAGIGMLILCMKVVFFNDPPCCLDFVCGDFAARRMREPLAFGNIAPSAACMALVQTPWTTIVDFLQAAAGMVASFVNLVRPIWILLLSLGRLCCLCSRHRRQAPPALRLLLHRFHRLHCVPALAGDHHPRPCHRRADNLRLFGLRHGAHLGHDALSTGLVHCQDQAGREVPQGRRRPIAMVVCERLAYSSPVTRLVRREHS